MDDDLPLDDQLPSREQGEWTRIIDGVRVQLIRLAEDPAMSPNDMSYLVGTAAVAIRLDLEARLFDERLRRAQDRFGCDH